MNRNFEPVLTFLIKKFFRREFAQDWKKVYQMSAEFIPVLFVLFFQTFSIELLLSDENMNW